MGLYVAHHHPGRLRMRASAFEHEPAAADARRAAAACAGVRSVVTSTRTGSVLVEYDASRIQADAIVDCVAHATGLPVADGRGHAGDEDRLALVAIDAVRELNAIAVELTHHRADLRVLVPAALAGLGVYSLAADARLPPWDSLLYWSYAVFMSVNQREVARSGRGP